MEPSSEFDNVAFDPETLAILEGVFEEAWVSIQAQRNGNITRAALAERILKLAVKGERNPARLLDGALSGSKTDAERDRLEKALEEGLRETFPASDAVAVFSPHHSNRTRTIPHGPRAESSRCEGWKLMHRQGRPTFDRGDAVLDCLLHLLERAHLDLAHALARDAEFGARSSRVIGSSARRRASKMRRSRSLST